ncbi:hypothetical protein H206_06959 [Candidatus Electrothrix aarhusensis]|uniref:Uncharacterized protein n=1 Tax=Candidatus Electrothrix aarhusensis TaxID=1859131 RepID=A0A444J3S5_9BACT|nr:hypothetical protein H206_06959 [Candidatus Electrothrix aarhusensis]
MFPLIHLKLTDENASLRVWYFHGILIPRYKIVEFKKTGGRTRWPSSELLTPYFYRPCDI